MDRDRWQSHPNFPDQVLLLGSHDNFRRVSQYCIDRAAAGDSPRVIGSLYRRWIGAMRSHEAYEEGKLYPFLARRWCVSFDAAERGHRDLHEAHDAVIEALDGADGPGLQSALERHDQILRAHLEVEETMVIPLLLALSPEEFAEYYYHPIRVLLERLDQRDAEGQATDDGTTR